MAHHPDNPLERLARSIERVTFHAQELGCCVLQVKVRGSRDLVTVVGSAASVSAGEYVECTGVWHNDRTHGLQFKTKQMQIVAPPSWKAFSNTWYQGGSEASVPTLPGCG